MLLRTLTARWYDLRDTQAQALAATGWWFVKAPGRVWSIKDGCVAAVCAAMMLPTATGTADQRVPAPRGAAGPRPAAPAPPPAGAPAPAQQGGAPTTPTAAATAADHRNMMQQ